MAKPEKVAAVAEITEAFRGASAALLTEYRGLTVTQITTLRRALGKDTTYQVVKNTLTKRAAVDAGLPAIDDALFTGPTAIAFVGGDPVEAAKGMRDFARSNPPLVIKGGVVEGRFLTAAEITRLADLESRETLLGRLAGAMNASMSQAASLFQAPLSQVARLAAALQDKQQAEGSGEPAAEPAPADAEAGAPAAEPASAQG